MSQTINELVVFLEERSAQIMLETVLPKLIPDGIQMRCIAFEGKQDLEKNVTNKLRAWNNPKAAFVILRDQDSGNCKIIKQQLLAKCQQANKPSILVRIACHELESWYLGDLQAVETGLGLVGLTRQQNKRRFRSPDALTNAKQELQNIAGEQYQQIAGSRAIAPHMGLEDNRSRSFNVFITGVKQLLAIPQRSDEP